MAFFNISLQPFYLLYQMTRLIIDSGACGFTCKVEVEKIGKYQVTIKVQSQCKQIKKWPLKLAR